MSCSNLHPAVVTAFNLASPSIANCNANNTNSSPQGWTVYKWRERVCVCVPQAHALTQVPVGLSGADVPPLFWGLSSRAWGSKEKQWWQVWTQVHLQGLPDRSQHSGLRSVSFREDTASGARVGHRCWHLHW